MSSSIIIGNYVMNYFVKLCRKIKIRHKICYLASLSTARSILHVRSLIFIFPELSLSVGSTFLPSIKIGIMSASSCADCRHAPADCDDANLTNAEPWQECIVNRDNREKKWTKIRTENRLYNIYTYNTVLYYCC